MNGELLVVGADRAGAFPSIGAARAAARPGATISVRPGRYEENLVVDRMVSINADGGEVEVHAAGGSVLVVDTEGVQLRGLRITWPPVCTFAAIMAAGWVVTGGAGWLWLAALASGGVLLGRCMEKWL